jgi:hypothetical protein
MISNLKTKTNLIPNLSWKRKLGILALGLAMIAWGMWYFWDEPLLTPLTAQPLFHFLTSSEATNTSNKIVYGYLPYWNLKKVTLQPELTHLAYFGLTIGGDGSIVTRTDEGGEPGYTKLKDDVWLDLANHVENQDGRVEIVLAQFDNDTIVKLLTNPQAKTNLIKSIDSLLLAYPVSGLNIDIEYTGEVSPRLRQQLVNLTKEIRQHLTQKYSHVNLSMAMYASAATSEQIWDVGGLEPHLDQIVIMAYDFHRRSSPQAGPVAPLFGGKELWDSDIHQHLKSFVQKVPSQKLLLGVPFYGYEWQTTSRDSQAHTFPDTGATASFQRVQELLLKKDELKVKESWNESALSPFLSYQENNQTFVVYYENSRSLSYKLDYVNQLNLGGIAIWALGYEGISRELWDVVARKI